MDRTSGLYYDEVGGNRLFTNGPPGTRVEEVWLNDLQEELIQTIEGMALTPTANVQDQLRKSFGYMCDSLMDRYTYRDRIEWVNVSTVKVKKGWYNIGNGVWKYLSAA